MRDLLFKQKIRYSDFLESEERVATNILTDRLRRLEVDGIITRYVAPRNAGGITYQLTPKGLDLAPMLVETILWSAKYDSETAASAEFVSAARKNREKLLTGIVRATQTATAGP